MDIEILKKIFERDLIKLKEEINLYQEEPNLWLVDKNIANSGGNLCLHLVGNLNTYIGAELGNSNFVRDRIGEFGDKDIPRVDLLNTVDETKKIVDAILEKMNDTELGKTYPVEVFREPMTTGFFLVHLATHLTYHLGQINYHRRLLDVDKH